MIVVFEQTFAARVVTLQLSVTPPTLTVAPSAVLKDAELVNCTRNVWPFEIVPVVTHAPPLMEISGDPCPLTDTVVPVLMPLIVMGADVIRVVGATPI